MSMGIFTSMMALVGSGVGSVISHAGDRAKREQAALELDLSGVCRSTSAEFESDLTARFKWNWDHERTMFEPEIIEFLELNTEAFKDYIKYRVREETVKAGFIPTDVAKLGGDYRQFFLDKYEQEMFYWIHCKDKGIEYKPYRQCPVCGRHIINMDEKCPVCDNPPMLKLDKTYRKVKAERDELIKERAEVLAMTGISVLWNLSLKRTLCMGGVLGLLGGLVLARIIQEYSDISLEGSIIALVLSIIAGITIGCIWGYNSYHEDQEERKKREEKLAELNKKLGL